MYEYFEVGVDLARNENTYLLCIHSRNKWQARKEDLHLHIQNSFVPRQPLFLWRGGESAQASRARGFHKTFVDGVSSPYDLVVRHKSVGCKTKTSLLL